MNTATRLKATIRRLKEATQVARSIPGIRREELALRRKLAREKAERSKRGKRATRKPQRLGSQTKAVPLPGRPGEVLSLTQHPYGWEAMHLGPGGAMVRAIPIPPNVRTMAGAKKWALASLK